MSFKEDFNLMLPEMLEVLGDEIAITLNGGAGATIDILGVFEVPFEVSDEDTEVTVVASNPTIRCNDVDVVAVEPGDTVLVESKNFIIINSEPNGNGMTFFQLEKV